MNVERAFFMGKQGHNYECRSYEAPLPHFPSPPLRTGLFSGSPASASGSRAQSRTQTFLWEKGGRGEHSFLWRKEKNANPQT